MSKQQGSVIETLMRHERAAQSVTALTHRIGVKLGHCPIYQQSMLPQSGGELFAGDGRVKTHLWQAFNHREPSSCGHGLVGLHQDALEDALSHGSDYACRHCKRAWQLIQQRKAARQELGRAKRSIRALGRAALAKHGGRDEN